MNPEQLPLRDLHLPDPIGWWPLAPGWWILCALALAGLGWLLYRRFQAWKRGAARRLALAELARLGREYRDGTDALTLAKSLSELVRRGMLAYAPRDEMAGLTGDRWLEWLDRGLVERPFTEGPGRALETLPYQRPESIVDETDLDGLLAAVRLRLKTPLPEGSS